MNTKPFKRVLAIDPYSRGVGFAVLEGPHELVDWGLRTTARPDNERAVRKIRALIGRFRPDVLALEDWEAEGARRCSRVEILLNLVANGAWEGLRVRLLSRRDLRRIGPLPHASTKYGRALLLAERFPELRPFLPPVRKTWMSEDDRMSIFDAVGFAAACLPIACPPAEPSEGPSDS